MVIRKSKSTTKKDITAANPNPHGEQKVAQMPLQTDQREMTRKNVARNPSTVENRLNPSVNGPLEDPTDDSMFNNADPQTRELLQKESKRQTKTSKHRKLA